GEEVGAGRGEEGRVGSPRAGAGDRVLAGAGRPDGRAARGVFAAEPLELAGIAQELDDLLEILLRLVNARHILEGHAPVRLSQKLRTRLAEAERLAACTLHLPRQENPYADERDERQPRDQELQEPGYVVLQRTRRDRYALVVEPLDQGRVVRGVGLELPAVREGAVNLRALDHDLLDPILIDLVQKLREGDFGRLRALARILEHREQGQEQQDDNDPQREIPQIGVHALRPLWRAGQPDKLFRAGGPLLPARHVARQVIADSRPAPPPTFLPRRQLPT